MGRSLADCGNCPNFPLLWEWNLNPVKLQLLYDVKQASHGVLVLWRWQYFLYFSFVSCNEILQMLHFIYLSCLLLFLFYLFIYLFKTVTVKRKNCDTRIMVDFGRLNLPKKTSWTSLMATKFQKKLPRKLSVTSNNNFFFFFLGDWVRRMWGTRMPRYSSGWRQWSG